MFTYIGYESVPGQKDTLESDIDDFPLVGSIITRSEYTHFIHCEVSLVARTLQLADKNDMHTLLKFVQAAYLNPLSYNIHGITLSDALEAIHWLETTSVTKVATMLAWTKATAQDVSVFATAARKLLPDFALQPGFTLTESNTGFKLKGFVLYARERNTSLMGKARAWSARTLAARRKKFFDLAIEEGLVPSVQDLNEKASKDELDKKASKEDIKAELEQLKEGYVEIESKIGALESSLEVLKGIVSHLIKGHPLAEELDARLQKAWL